MEKKVIIWRQEEKVIIWRDGVMKDGVRKRDRVEKIDTKDRGAKCSAKKLLEVKSWESRIHYERKRENAETTTLTQCYCSNSNNGNDSVWWYYCVPSWHMSHAFLTHIVGCQMNLVTATAEAGPGVDICRERNIVALKFSVQSADPCCHIAGGDDSQKSNEIGNALMIHHDHSLGAIREVLTLNSLKHWTRP